jgi:hypothetical protein
MIITIDIVTTIDETTKRIAGAVHAAMIVVIHMTTMIVPTITGI